MAFDIRCGAEVAGFFRAIAPWRDGLSGPRFHFVSIKRNDQFNVFAGRLIFLNAEDATEERHFQTENILAGQFLLSSLGHSPEDFVEQIGRGTVLTPHGELAFPPDSNPDFRAMLSRHHHRGIVNQQRLTLLQIVGGPIGNPMNDPALEWELKAAPLPYGTFGDLLGEFGLVGVTDGMSTIEVAAFPAAAFDASSSVDGTMAKPVVLLAKGLSPESFRLGVVEYSQGLPKRRYSISGSDFSWTGEDRAQRGTAEITVSDGATLYCVTNYDGQAQSWYWLTDPTTSQNMRRAAYIAFDPGTEIMTDYLTREDARKGNSHDFEEAVSWLLWMLGFSGVNLGGNDRTRDAPDLIFNTPEGHFAVVECTRGHLKSGQKLTTLIERAERIRNHLKRSGNNHLRVLPVLATAATRESIKADLEQAERLGVFVVAREELAELINQTVLPPTPTQQFARAEQHVQSRLDVLNKVSGGA